MRPTRAERDAAQREIADQFQALPEEFLDCRDPGLRHQWHKTKDFHVIAVEKIGTRVANLGREETCLRCGTVKREKFAVGKSVIVKVSQTYDYPEGYTISGVPRGVKRAEVVWSENYRRAMEGIADNLNGKG